MVSNSVSCLEVLQTMINVEPNLAEVTRLTIALPNLSPAFDGLTIVQISDWHLGKVMTSKKMLAIARQTNELAPDVIVHTGDYIDHIIMTNVSEITRSAEAFRASDGIFGILGNHDYFHVDPAIVAAAVQRAGNTRMLINANAAIRRGDALLYIAGVDDIWENKHNLKQALANIPENAPVILLAHEPDYADQVAPTGRVGLQLSGHTHGGQVRFPVKGPLVLPRLGQKYVMGMYDVNGMALYVNRGVGLAVPYFRLNCPPEITHFTLRAIA